MQLQEHGVSMDDSTQSLPFFTHSAWTTLSKLWHYSINYLDEDNYSTTIKIYWAHNFVPIGFQVYYYYFL